MKKNYSIASVYPFPFYIGDGHDTNFSLILCQTLYRRSTLISQGIFRFDY